jgi:hypothetical protein
MSRSDARSVDSRRRSWWLKNLHRWHWISAALCLIGMLGFAITGITLNHASRISATPKVVTRHAQLPEPLRIELSDHAEMADIDTPAPDALRHWLRLELLVDIAGRAWEWASDEIYVSMPRAGGDGWIAIDLAQGTVESEQTELLSELGDLDWGDPAFERTPEGDREIGSHPHAGALGLGTHVPRGRHHVGHALVEVPLTERL